MSRKRTIPSEKVSTVNVRLGSKLLNLAKTAEISPFSMGSSLGPVLANIILTEFERLIVSELIADGTIKFYKRYVDDTLVLIKPSDISAVLAKFNSFDPNLTFTVDTFSEGIVHFLDIKVSVDGTDIYRKDTHTGQYSHFSSFEPSYRKTAWVYIIYILVFILLKINKIHILSYKIIPFTI